MKFFGSSSTTIAEEGPKNFTLMFRMSRTVMLHGSVTGEVIFLTMFVLFCNGKLCNSFILLMCVVFSEAADLGVSALQMIDLKLEVVRQMGDVMIVIDVAVHFDLFILTF